jgi:hypothetical protein
VESHTGLQPGTVRAMRLFWFATTPARGSAVKNITLMADEKLIEAARARARSEGTTLNEQFRLWLETYARSHARMEQHDAVVRDTRSMVRIGRKPDRNAMNQR